MSLKQLRIKKGLSQKELGDKINWTQKEVSKLESGKRKIDFVKGVELAKVLGVKLDELIKHL